MKFFKKEKLILGLILAISLFLNFYRLESLPAALHNDEAETGLEALRILRGESPLIGVSRFYGVPLSSFLHHSLTILFFGSSIFGVRAASAFIGSLTLLVFFYFGKTLFDSKRALLATALLAFSHFWIAFSRLGINYNLSVLFIIFAFIFLIKFLKTYRWQDGFWLGVFNASAFYLYFSSRIVPIITLVVLIWLGRKKKNIFWISLGFFLAALPMLFVLVDHPQTFMSRTNNVFVFSPEVKPWRDDVYQTDSKMKIIFLQAKKTLNLSRQSCESSGQYGYCGRLFDVFSLFFFFLGMFVVRHRFLFIWFWLIIFFGSFLTVPPLFMPRLLGALPVFYLFCSLGFYWLKKQWSSGFLNIILVLIIFLIITNNLIIYFVQYPGKTWGDGNKYTATKIAQALQDYPDYQAVFLTAPFLYADFATLVYIAPEGQKINLASPSDYFFDQEKRQVIYVFYPAYQDKLLEAKAIYPSATLIDIRSLPHRPPSAYLLKID